MKPAYFSLKRNHYSSAEFDPSFVGAKAVYEEIGYDMAKLLEQNPDYQNTCAVRFSLALLKSGAPITGRLKIRKGPHAGASVETGAKLLADQLSKSHLFGKPELLKPSATMPELRNRRGAILFWKIFGYGGGHIDLIEPSTSGFTCHSSCHTLCKEIWFWPLH